MPQHRTRAWIECSKGHLVDDERRASRGAALGQVGQVPHRSGETGRIVGRVDNDRSVALQVQIQQPSEVEAGRTGAPHPHRLHHSSGRLDRSEQALVAGCRNRHRGAALE